MIVTNILSPPPQCLLYYDGLILELIEEKEFDSSNLINSSS